jgi:type II pantothenate kinase
VPASAATASDPSPGPLEPFVQLPDPSRYVACDWNLTDDDDSREHWVRFFIQHIRTLTGAGVAAAVARGEAETSATRRADACIAAFEDRFGDYLARPRQHGRVTMLDLDKWRDGLLREHGFVDPLIDVKQRENDKMLPLLPGVVAAIDAIDDRERQVESLVRGIFAGNVFDLGAKATAAKFLGGSPDFSHTLATLPPRPWAVDHFDAFSRRLLAGYRRVVFFIDNAGSDFLLGALPMARWLARSGASVVIAANEMPTLNDMTVHDVRAIWPRVLAAEPSFDRLPIEIVSTGTAEPLIDLLGVSTTLNDASRDADLVILEGMGRGIESNFGTVLRCEVANLAMLKDEAVARRVGGELFGVVCRFHPGAEAR